MRENEALHASARRDLAGGVRAGERVLRYASQVLVRRELRAREIAALQVQVGAGRDAYERIVHDAVATEREDLALGLDAKAETIQRDRKLSLNGRRWPCSISSQITR